MSIYQKIVNEVNDKTKLSLVTTKEVYKFLDLTLLKDDIKFFEKNNINEYQMLCEKASINQFAAVCIYPQWIEYAKGALSSFYQSACNFPIPQEKTMPQEKTISIKTSVEDNKKITISHQSILNELTTSTSHPINVATVANFPKGNMTFSEMKQELDFILEAKPDEIDVVFPYQDYLNHNIKLALSKMEFYRNHIPKTVKLKVILETDAFYQEKDIETISKELIDLSVDFLKTSTGKEFQGADPLKSAIMLTMIAKYSSQKIVGFKASGGIRTLTQAHLFMQMTSLLIDKHFLHPNTFRIGTSQLISE